MLSINPQNLVISVPKADLLNIQMVPSEIWELDLNWFRLQLKNLEDSEDGIFLPTTHNHVAPITVGGVTLARVVELINGYTVTFEDGQYAVNLVGANSNVADKTNVNQVSVRSANSAGLTYSKEIEDQSFLDGRVWIDTVNGTAGTQFPSGTHTKPVTTYTDANTIIATRNLSHRFAFRGSLTLTSPAGISDENWLGENAPNAILNFVGGVSVSNSTFNRIGMTGAINGNFTLENGLIQNVTGFMGDCYIVGFSGTTTIPSGSMISDIRVLKDCYSTVAGTSTPIFDFNNATDISWQFRGWTGGLEIRNYSDASNVLSIDLISGRVILHSSCTAGTIVIRGAGHLTDNSNGATIIKKGLVYTENLLQEKRWLALS